MTSPVVYRAGSAGRKVLPYGMSDFWARHFRREVLEQFGDYVSFTARGKSLTKFGRTRIATAGTRATVAQFQGSITEEVFATANTVTHLVSSSAADAGKPIRVEGQVLGPGDSSTFASQTVACQGQTPVALTTPLFRATRAFNAGAGTPASPAPELVGTVAVYDSSAAGGVSSGVPVNAAATKLLISAGEQQSYKAASTISGSDYWPVESFIVGAERATGGSVNIDVSLEIRAFGGVWLPLIAEVPLRTSANPTVSLTLEPWLIVPPNHDVRVVAVSDTNTTDVFATFAGPLAQVVEPSDWSSYEW